MNVKVEEAIKQMRQSAAEWKFENSASGDVISSVISNLAEVVEKAVNEADEEIVFTAINNYEEGKRKGYEMAHTEMPFGDAVPIENMTSQEQMDMIYKNIAPVILSMSETYPNSTAHPVFKFDCNPETQEIKVTLSELNFKIGN